jgi:hypothetical protein
MVKFKPKKIRVSIFILLMHMKKNKIEMGENKIKKPSMSFVALIKIYLQKIRGK